MVSPLSLGRLWVIRISRLLSTFSRYEEMNRGGVLKCTKVFMNMDPCPVQDSLMGVVADVPPFSAGLGREAHVWRQLRGGQRRPLEAANKVLNV